MTPRHGVFAMDPHEPDDARWFAASLDGAVVAVGAVRDLGDGRRELKSMHTAAGWRGRGIGTAMIVGLVQAAAEDGATDVVLETGNMAAFDGARALYRRFGFEECEPFGPYVGSTTSACMRRSLVEPVLRDASLGDVPAIVELLNALIPTTAIEWRDHLYDQQEATAWLRAHPVTIVADVGGRAVGVAAYGPFRDWHARPGYATCVEHSVHVAAAHGGRGLGRRLMHALIDRARRDRHHTMVAAIDHGNAASITFHERLGFEHAGRLPEIGISGDTWRDLVLLVKRLDDRSAPDPIPAR